MGSKPESDMIALAASVETPRKEPQTETLKSRNLPPKQSTFNANQQTTSTPNASFQCHCTLPIPRPELKGFVWKPRWELVQRIWMLFLKKKQHHQNWHLKKKSFEELALEKIKEPANLILKFLLLTLNMFLLAGILFHMENLLREFAEGLFTESLVLHHDF